MPFLSAPKEGQGVWVGVPPGICCILRGPQPQQRKQWLHFPTARPDGIKMSLWRAASSSLSEDIRSKLIWLIQWQTPRAPGLDPFMNGLFLTCQKPFSFGLMSCYLKRRKSKRVNNSFTGLERNRPFYFSRLDSGSLSFSPGRASPRLWFYSVYVGSPCRKTCHKALANVKGLKRSCKYFSFLILSLLMSFLLSSERPWRVGGLVLTGRRRQWAPLWGLAWAFHQWALWPGVWLTLCAPGFPWQTLQGQLYLLWPVSMEGGFKEGVSLRSICHIYEGHFTSMADTYLLLAMVRFFCFDHFRGQTLGKRMFSFLRGKYVFSFLGGGEIRKGGVLAIVSPLMPGSSVQMCGVTVSLWFPRTPQKTGREWRRAGQPAL